MKWIKAMAKQLFLPSCGGNYKVWDVQPLTQELMDYCCDTHTFFALCRLYCQAEAWAATVLVVAMVWWLTTSLECDYHEKLTLALAWAMDWKLHADV